MKGRKGIIAIKIDPEKAYGSLRWDFIHENLYLAGFPSNIIQLIMQCVTNSSFQVL